MVIFDGLLIVWVIIEYLYEVNWLCVFFVIYYYELMVLLVKLDCLLNVMVLVKEWNGEVIFLYEIVFGVVDCFYGIQVVKFVGLLLIVVECFKQVFSQLEEQDCSILIESLINELLFFVIFVLVLSLVIGFFEFDFVYEVLEGFDFDDMML